MKKSRKKTMKNIQNKRAKRDQRKRSCKGFSPRLVWSEGKEKYYEFDQGNSENPGIFSSMLIREIDDSVNWDDEEAREEAGDFKIDLFF
ncbi:MAG: hypothetical protein JXR70_10140 [Spirochaetales bacterium]|nr:hypothetical protein [Spirochaetales bacterium]